MKAKIVAVYVFMFFGTALQAKAQIPVEVMAGHEQLQHEFFFFKDLDTNRKVNLFSMARFAVDYDEEAFNNSFVSSQLTYNLNQTWGISGGALMANGNFVPLAAVSYSYFNKKGDLFINLFPTVLFNDEIEFEMFGYLLYTPKLTNNFKLFTQAIFGTTVNKRFDEHLFGYQQFRVGLDYRGLFQFGVGFDQNFFGQDYDYTNNLGVFIRKEF